MQASVKAVLCFQDHPTVLGLSPEITAALRGLYGAIRAADGAQDFPRVCLGWLQEVFGAVETDDVLLQEFLGVSRYWYEGSLNLHAKFWYIPPPGLGSVLNSNSET